MRKAADCVTFSDVEVGIDSNSGLAVSVFINDEWHWIPYSQVESIHRDPSVRGNDRIVLSKWIAEKKGLL